MADEAPPRAELIDPPTVVGNPHAPHVFADEAFWFFVKDGVVRITFSVTQPEIVAPSGYQNVMIGSLDMPVAGAQRLAVGLFDFLKQHGLDPAAVVGGVEQTKQ